MLSLSLFGLMASCSENKESDEKSSSTTITKAEDRTDLISEEDKKMKEEGISFLNSKETSEGVAKTESGLLYEVITEGEGEKPVASNTVKVHYTGSFIDGKVFDSSVERGEPIEFPLTQVIAGWTEGLQLMSVGSKYKFYIPYNLAYGDKGYPGAIPPYSTLIFEVELLDFK